MPRSFRLALTAALMGAALATVPGVASAERVPGTPYVTSTPAGAVFESSLRDVVAGLKKVDAYERRRLGVVLTRTTRVHLVPGRRCLGFPQAADFVGGVTDGHVICLYTESPVWPEDARMRGAVAAHEAIHVLQAELGCARRAPTWFIEGSAQLLGVRTMAHPDTTEQDIVTSFETRAGGYALSPGGLRASERSRTRLNYDEAALAAATLDRGNPVRLVTFCRAVGRGTAWPRAFAAAFGESVDAFYTRFSRIRARIVRGD
jgi:hypothetical protein